MVIANGTILTANIDENPDLFWGVRGGGCNFGVCTEFVLRLHNQRRTVYSGIMIFPSSTLETLMKATQASWKRGLSPKEGMLHYLVRGPAPDGKVRNSCISLFEFY